MAWFVVTVVVIPAFPVVSDPSLIVRSQAYWCLMVNVLRLKHLDESVSD